MWASLPYMSRASLDLELSEIIEVISTTAGDISDKLATDFDTYELDPQWAAQLESDLYDLDSRSVELLWREQPFAKDLRLLMALIHASAHLRRASWLVNHLILNWSNLDSTVAPPKVRELLLQLKSKTLDHYRFALGAFLSGDLDWAISVEQTEARVDKFCEEARESLSQVWAGRHDAEQVQAVMSSGLFVRFAERIADHATAISRHVEIIQSSSVSTTEPNDVQTG